MKFVELPVAINILLVTRACANLLACSGHSGTSAEAYMSDRDGTAAGSEWQSDSDDGAIPYCEGEGCASTPPSCRPADDGGTLCGAIGESCCTSLDVEGGAFYRTYANAGDGAAGEADLASVSGFRLDKYLVTVGRFRQFVTAWNGGAGYTPAPGSGKHAHLNGGLGLVNNDGTFEPGWVTSDNSYIAPTNSHLACYAGYATWTDAAGSDETLPINCINWYEAYAFCIWDGGFLPSEAEWEYAAVGGSEQLEYPWGSIEPGNDDQYAIYGCYYPSGLPNCTGLANIAAVGTATLGVGLWGQLDMAGEVWEWTMDYYAAYSNPCTDCAELSEAPFRVYRGGDFGSDTEYLLPQNRGGDFPSNRFSGMGFRCARAQ